MSVCNRCTRPIWGYVGFGQSGSGSSSGQSSAGAAWSAAVANFAYGSTVQDVVVGSNVESVTPFALSELSGVINDPFHPDTVTWAADARGAKWWMRFYTSTCYFKLFWDEVTYHPEDAEILRTARTWTWTPAGDAGLCLAAGTVLHDQGASPAGDETLWPVTDIFEITTAMTEPPDPGNPPPPDLTIGSAQRVAIGKLRLSLIDGWVPTYPQGPFPE